MIHALYAISKIRKNTSEHSTELRTNTMMKVSIGAGIVLSLMSLGVAVYVFICIDSLYKMFEEEKFPPINPGIVQPGPYVVNYQPQHHNPYYQAPVYYPSTIQKY